MQPTETPKMNQGTEATVDSIAHDGDIVLAVGLDSRRLQVSSSVLKRSSRVFGALLGPKFSEGQVPTSSQQPKDIALPDDDARAMFDMCCLIHNIQVNDLIVCPTADRILAFAVVVDKYDCVEALRLQIQGLLLGYPLMQEDLDFDHLTKNLLASYLLRHSLAFKVLCGRAIIQSTRPFMSMLEGEWAKLFPSNLIYALEQKRSAVQQRIVFDLPRTGIPKTPACAKCGLRDVTHISTLQTRFAIPFWPPNFVPRGTCTLSAAIDLIKNFDTMSVAKCIHLSPIDVRSSFFKDFANSLIEDCMKLCLKCIMAGKMDFKDQCENELHVADYKSWGGV